MLYAGMEDLCKYQDTRVQACELCNHIIFVIYIHYYIGILKKVIAKRHSFFYEGRQA